MSDLTEVLADGKRRLVVWPTQKFKTLLLSAFLYRPLSRPSATRIALLSKLFKRGCEGYPGTKELQIHLDELYGAKLTTGVLKVGEEEALYVSLEIPIAPADRPNEIHSLLAEGMDLLQRIVRSPVLAEEHIAQETENVRKELEDLKSDKERYAVIRCIQEMCKDEPFGISEIGDLEDLRHTTQQDVQNEFGIIKERTPLETYLVGPFEQEVARELFERAFPPGIQTEQRISPRRVTPAEIRQVVERDDITQAKLCIGLRTNIWPGEQLYPALTMFDGILGGFVHSKLFLNVRERSSLAYYANSWLKPSKGIMMITSGIDPVNYEKALGIILEQLELMKRGDISEQEMNWTRSGIANRLKTAADSAMAQVLADAELRTASLGWTLERRLEMLEGVTLDQVVEVAQAVKVDTVYLLTPRGENA
ncbi:MAG TPA: insulinase family protein [Firmicutes bacterium]|nr:insulinase family protein [Bacillota bacterium]